MRRFAGTGAALALVCAAEFLVVGAIAVVAIALPTLGRDLDAGPVALQWVLTAYVLCFGGLLLPAGRLADIAGRRRLVAVGLGVFAAGSLASGLAGSLGVLIAARALQGAGAALLTPAALAIATTLHGDGPRRARAVAAWTAAQAGGAAAGWVAGGLLTQALGWRAVFLVPVPAALLLLALVPRVLPADRGARGGAGRADLPGAACATGCVALAILGLTRIEAAGLSDAGVWAALAAAAALGVLFAALERRAPDPLLPRAALRSARLGAANAGAFAFQAATNAPLLLCILLLQDEQGRSPVEAGLAFVPFNAAVVSASLAGGRLLTRSGHAALLAAGLGAIAAANLALARVTAAAGYVEHLLPAFLLMGAGVGAAAVATTSLATSALRGGRAALAGGILSTTSELGYAAGLALLVTLASAAAPPGDAVAGFRVAFLAAAGLAAAALPVALALARCRMAV